MPAWSGHMSATSFSWWIAGSIHLLAAGFSRLVIRWLPAVHCLLSESLGASRLKPATGFGRPLLHPQLKLGADTEPAPGRQGRLKPAAGPTVISLQITELSAQITWFANKADYL